MNFFSAILRYSPIFLLVSSGLIYLGLTFEVDGYRAPFVQASQFSGFHDLFVVTLRDPGYSFIQNFFAKLIRFEVFMVAFITSSLLIKYLGFIFVNRRPTLLDFLPYLLTLGFLHEPIQIRAAMALAISFWSMILFVRNQKLWALLVLLLAGTFHASALVFVLAFLLLWLFDRFQYKVFYVGLALVAGLSFLPNLPELLKLVGQTFNSRYLIYIDQAGQNKTGLFAYYYLFVGGLTLLVAYLFKAKDAMWQRWYQLSIASGCLSFAVLLVFHFSVNIASRLADILLFPLTLVLGALLVQLKQDKKYFLLILIVLGLSFYCGLRGIISYAPSMINFKSFNLPFLPFI
jgi:hypothetical protein